jgi:hypothetical protein
MSPEMIAEVYNSIRERLRAWRANRRLVTAPQRAESMNTLLNVKKKALKKSDNNVDQMLPNQDRPQPVPRITVSKKGFPETTQPENPTGSDLATTSRLLEAKRKAKRDKEE